MHELNLILIWPKLFVQFLKVGVELVQVIQINAEKGRKVLIKKIRNDGKNRKLFLIKSKVLKRIGKGRRAYKAYVIVGPEKNEKRQRDRPIPRGRMKKRSYWPVKGNGKINNKEKGKFGKKLT